MKKVTLMGLAGAALLCACQPTQKGTTISGTLTGVESDTLLVNILAMPPVENSPRIADTIAMQQGKFNLELQADTLPLQVSIYAKPTGNKALDMRHSIHVVALPGDVLTVNGSMEDYSVEGSDLYASLNEAEKTWQPTIDSLQTILKKRRDIDPTDLPEDSTITAQIQALGQRAMALHIDYIRQHPDEDASVFLASQSGSRKKIKARKEAEAKIKEGLPAPDFTLNDLNGQPLSLSSLRGKYVVLDFWGSWCGWCIKGIPDMKKYYEKYKGKLEILGIDCRDTEEKWKAAVEKHELPWLHVYNAGDPDVSILYAIQGYPTKIVVAPEGKIAKVVVGEDPAFYEYLDELFK